MTVHVTPLHDRVLVRRLEEKETAKGGIIIPDTAKEKPQEGEVMAVGAGKIEKGQRIPLDVKVGDRILFGKYTGNDIKIDDQEYLILREEEILAKLSGAAKAALASVASSAGPRIFPAESITRPCPSRSCAKLSSRSSSGTSPIERPSPNAVAVASTRARRPAFTRSLRSSRSRT